MINLEAQTRETDNEDYANVTSTEDLDNLFKKKVSMII